MRGVHVVRRVAEHDDSFARRAGSLNRGLHDVGIRLRALGVIGRGLTVDEIRDACPLEQDADFILLRRARNDDRVSIVHEALYEWANLRKRSNTRKIAGGEELGAAGADPGTLRRVRADPGYLRDQLIGAHADGAPDPLVI